MKRSPSSLSPLPIDEHLPTVFQAMASGRNLVISAEPGAGKTTRVPAAILEWLESQQKLEKGDVWVLEPRRLAARLSAERVAEELGESIGERVGYAVRFEERTSQKTRLRFVTEGILSRRFARDPHLRGTQVIVLDEVHERSIHTDLALALCRHLQRTARPDLRIVAMSATLDAEALSAFLDADVILAKGRTFPVNLRYAPSDASQALRPWETWSDALSSHVARVCRQELEAREGDVLVFLPGAGEIRRCMEAMASLSSLAEVVPLHGDLSADEQRKTLALGPRRKVIVSTNIAETSVTLPRITSVLDSGLVRKALHSPFSGFSSLEVVSASRSSCVQRAGRAGRVQEGYCVRLFSEHSFRTRAEFDEPEILRSDLSETVLTLVDRKVLGDPIFSFLASPTPAQIERSLALLQQLDFIEPNDSTWTLTEEGARALSLPMHPRLARALMVAHRCGNMHAGAELVAVLSERDVRLSRRARLGAGGNGHQVERSDSDILSRLAAYRDARDGYSSERVDTRSVRAIKAQQEQIEQVAKRLLPNEDARASLNEDDALSRALLRAFPDRVAKRRAAKSMQFLLPEGRAIEQSDRSEVQDAEWVVFCEAEERDGKLKGTAASAITTDDLLEELFDRVTDTKVVRLNGDQVEAFTGLSYGTLTFDEKKVDPRKVPEAAEVLSEAVLKREMHRAIDREKWGNLRVRMELLRSVDPSVPSLDDSFLRAAVTHASQGKISVAEVLREDLFSWIEQEIGYATISRLNELCPPAVSLPGRKNVPISYEEGKPPFIESRMQDFFGLKTGPTVLNQPLVLHLLAPNGRAEQVTTDLQGFYRDHYPVLRKALMRKYPRHPWPEDPTVPAPPRAPRIPR